MTRSRARVRDPLILIIGASGVGKSTLIASYVQEQVVASRNAFLLRKETTRDLRGEAEHRECKHLSREEFNRIREAGGFILEYEVFHEWYGVLRESVLNRTSPAEYLQTFPTAVAESCRADLRDYFDIRICLLEAHPAIVRERLLRRGDPGTLSTLEERMSTASRERRSVADGVIDANGPVESVMARFLAWVEGASGN